jgi:hypothetical protein
MIVSIVLLSVCLHASFAQSRLQPGFDGKEYLTMLQIVERQTYAVAPTGNYKTPGPQGYQKIFSSQAYALDNQWDLWQNADHTIDVICIRGTTLKTASWLENFNAAMIPANGTVYTQPGQAIRYKLSADSNAYVHMGWTLGMLMLAPEITGKIKEEYTRGVHQFIVLGHSQGGAIAFLLRSYLQYLDDPQLPQDIVYKTYCSAAPKPGNLNYAYDFDFITRNGWAFRVVNALDWVPETPFSVQTLKDFTPLNPFKNIKGALRKQPFFLRLYGNYVSNRIDRSQRKLVRLYKKYLGKMVGKQVEKIMVSNPMHPAIMVNSSNYMPAGSPVILQPTPAYLEKYTDQSNIFLHHLPAPYHFLTEHYYGSGQ